MTSIVNRFIDLDASTISANPSDFFVNEFKVAYVSPAAVALRGILDFNTTQFQLNKLWILSFLSKMILCGDRTLRESTKEIYDKHVHPKV